MILGISSDGWAMIGVVAGGISTMASGLMARANVATKKAHELELQSVRDANAGEIKSLTSSVDRLETSHKAAWDKIDDLRENAVRKAELKEYRAELKHDIEELGTRLERLFKDALDNFRHGKEGV